MSALAAVLDLTDAGHGPSRVRAMTHAMRYAALDGEHHWADAGMALGHCAMHATAEARDTRLPLLTPDGRLALSMDGYIANYDEVIRQVTGRGAALRDRSDAELVLQAWAIMGAQCLDLFDGEFAIAVADRQSGRLHLARDHMGLRPLFYSFDGKRLVAASHIGGVLAGLDRQPEPNRGFLAEILTFEYVTPGETVWSGIDRVKPAHVITIGPEGLSQRKYWSVPDEPQIRYKDDGEYVEHYREVLTESVRRAARTDSLLGVECSGGLDSSAIFAVADELQRAGRLPAPDIAGVTLAPPAQSAADELRYARAVASHLDRKLTECPLYLPEAAEILDQAEQSGNIAPYPNTFMSQEMGRAMATKGCRAIMNGQGGDHFLDGNSLYYHEAFAEGELGRLAGYLKRDWHEVGPRAALAMLMRGALSNVVPQPLLRARVRLAWSDEAITKRVARFDWLSPELQGLLRERIAASRPQGRYVDEYKQIKVSHPLIGHLLDMLAEQNARIGLEARAPMMSRSFIEFFGRTPERIRRQGRKTRVVHRRAMTGKLPEVVLERTDKAGFALAFEQYLDLAETRLSRPISPTGQQLFSKDEIASLVSKCRSPKIDAVHNWVVWGALSVLDLDSRINPANSVDG